MSVFENSVLRLNTSQYSANISRLSRYNIENNKELKEISNKSIKAYTKMCNKNFSSVNNNFLVSLKYDNLLLSIDNFKLKEIPSISRIISIYFYFKTIKVGVFENSSKIKY